MRRRASNSKWPSLSLFPFLAVLICTMGILIVLLVVVTKMADQSARQAQAEAKDKTAAQLESAQDDLEIEQFRIDQISRMRDGVRSKLIARQNVRSHVEQEIRELKDQFQQTIDEYQRFIAIQGKKELTDANNAHTAEIDAIQSQIQKAVLLKNELSNQNSVAPVVYSVVPTDAVDGTNRRPIYVECRRDGIMLQPSGILLMESDFEKPIMAGNPFDSSLLAIREHWSRAGVTGTDGQPYPLLIVRPGGANAYAVARRAMKNWDDQFGYELVEADKELDFGEADPKLKITLNEVIQQAKLFQQNLARFNNQDRGNQIGNSSQGGNGGLPAAAGGLRASRTGGFVAEGTLGPINPNDNSNQYLNKTDDGQTTPTDATHSQSSSSQFGSSNSDDRQNKNGSDGKHANAGNENGPGKNPSSSIAPIANVRGANWALPTRTVGAVAYSRPIKIICAKNELVLEPSAQTSNRQIRIPIEITAEKSVESLVQTVWDVIDSWGIAASGGYWKPNLVFKVLPDGQKNYQEINKLLKGSGLEVMLDKTSNR